VGSLEEAKRSSLPVKTAPVTVKKVGADRVPFGEVDGTVASVWSEGLTKRGKKTEHHCRSDVHFKQG